MRAILVASGPITDYGWARGLFTDEDYIVVADGGLRHTEALGLQPDLVVGDFDSAGREALERLRAKNIPIIELPVDKDLTDTEAALREILKLGYHEVTIVGGLGGRLDHFLGNLSLLAGFAGQANLTLLGEGVSVWLLAGEAAVQVPAVPAAYLSLIPLTPVCRGVSVTGVRWPLDQVELTWGSTWGVSNEFMGGDGATITLTDGLLAVVRAC